MRADIEGKLESVQETIICIPFDGTIADSEADVSEYLDEEHFSFHNPMYTPPELSKRDLPDGPFLRMRAFEEAFGRCRARILDIVHEVHSETVGRIVDAVGDAYKPRDEERLIPYNQVPAIAISGTDRSATRLVLDEALCLLSANRDIDNVDMQTESVSADVNGRKRAATKGKEYEPSSKSDSNAADVIVSRLVPTDCTSLTSAMKVLIGGFLASYHCNENKNETQTLGASRQLAAYDINILEPWFRELQKSRDGSPKLVIYVDDLDKIEPAIMQDIIYICSLHVPQLPFVFIFALSSSSASLYMHSVYRRKTLALLRLTQITVDGGIKLFEKIMLETFFSVESLPTIIPSPATIDFIYEQFARNVQSIDYVIHLLRLIHMRHFIEPITIFAADELLGEKNVEDAARKLESPSAAAFLCSITARLQHRKDVGGASEAGEEGKRAETPTLVTPSKSMGGRKGKEKQLGASRLVDKPYNVLHMIREVREAHQKRALGSRVAFKVFLQAREFLSEDQLWSVAAAGRQEHGTSEVMQLIGECLRGTLDNHEGKGLVGGIKKLSSARLCELLKSLCSFVHESPDLTEIDAVTRLEEWCVQVDVSDSEASTVGEEFSMWLLDYLRKGMTNYTEGDLWDIWYTGSTHGIEELVNPAPRISITNALVHPERYLGYDNDSPAQTKTKKRLKNIAPHDTKDEAGLDIDTGLLFRRYLEGGRMVNVYDLYNAFSGALESRRPGSTLPPNAASEENSQRGSPSKTGSSVPNTPSRSRRGRGRSRKHESALEDDRDESDGGVNDERRAMSSEELQARFTRSFHELDFLGFVKHTGRKADHVQKTIYDFPEF